MARSLLKPQDIGIYAGDTAILEVEAADGRLSRVEVECIDAGNGDHFEIRCGKARVTCIYSRRKDKNHPRWRVWPLGVLNPENIGDLNVALCVADQLLRGKLSHQ